MKLTSNAHMHTTLCDGKNTPEEMVQAAINCDFSTAGFSGHSPLAWWPHCPGMIQDEKVYQDTMHALNKKYKDQITVLCGIEQDYFGPINKNEYDYVIGSVHDLRVDENRYVCVDNTPEEFTKAIAQDYQNDPLKLVKHFYQTTLENVQKYKPDIVGHFDLVIKHNRDNIYFDEESPQYQHIALEYLDAVIDILADYGGIVEINTGAMSRGYRDLPYPSPFLLKRLAEKKVRIMINSDSHASNTIDYAFDFAQLYAKSAGIQNIVQIDNGQFIETKLT